MLERNNEVKSSGIDQKYPETNEGFPNYHKLVKTDLQTPKFFTTGSKIATNVFSSDEILVPIR